MVGLHAIITKETLLVTYTCTMHALDAECQGEKRKSQLCTMCRIPSVDWMGRKGQPDQ